MRAPVKSEPPRPRVVVMPASLEAMKPPITGTLPWAVSGSSFSWRALFDEGVLRNGLLELRIGDDDFARVHVGGVDAPLAEGSGDDAAGDALAVADDQVGDARRQFENGGQAAQNFIQRVEFLVDQGRPARRSRRSP